MGTHKSYPVSLSRGELMDNPEEENEMLLSYACSMIGLVSRHSPESLPIDDDPGSHDKAGS